MSRTRGSTYEQRAADYLTRQGLVVLRQNVQIIRGEIDLIALDGGTLVFVEVKYRKHSRFGEAREMLSLKKQRLIIRTAELFLQRQPRYRHMPCRFDLIAITGETAKLDWIKSAFLIT